MASSAIFQTAALNKGEEHTKSTIKYLQGCFPSDSSTHTNTPPNSLASPCPHFGSPSHLLQPVPSCTASTGTYKTQGVCCAPVGTLCGYRDSAQCAPHVWLCSAGYNTAPSLTANSLSTCCTPFLIASSLGQHTPETIRNTSGMCVW